ncbi:DgyrCDS11400 [Dimorphilus gyrociliatus]|nr:DgyrCDS11400 [Dimorphilus gyrociliatus]
MPFLANNIRYFHRPTIVKVVERPEKKPRPISKSPKTVLPISIPLKILPNNDSSLSSPKVSARLSQEQGQIKVVILQDTNDSGKQILTKRKNSPNSKNLFNKSNVYSNKKIETKQIINKLLARVQKQHERNLRDEGPPECKKSAKYLFKLPTNPYLSFKPSTELVATIDYEFENDNVKQISLFDYTKGQTKTSNTIINDKSKDFDIVFSPRNGISMKTSNDWKPEDRLLFHKTIEKGNHYKNLNKTEKFVYNLYDELPLKVGINLSEEETLIVLPIPDDIEYYGYNRAIHSLKLLSYKMTMERLINDCLEALNSSKACKDLVMIIVNACYYVLQRLYYIQQIQFKGVIREQVRYVVLFDFPKESCPYRIQDMWMEMITVYFDIRFVMTCEIYTKFFEDCCRHLMQQTICCWEYRNSKRTHEHTSLFWPSMDEIKTLTGFCYEGSWRNQVTFDSPKCGSLRPSHSNFSTSKDKSKGSQRKKYPVELSPPRPKQIKRSARGATPPLPLPPAKRRRVKKLPIVEKVKEDKFISDKEMFLNVMKLVSKKKPNEKDIQ